MIVTMNLYKDTGLVSVQRQPDEKGCYGGGWGAEHLLLYRLKQRLNLCGFHLIKKRMRKDGHMWGSEETPYLRSANMSMKLPHIHIYDGNYAVRNSAKDFNGGNTVEFVLHGDIWYLQPGWTPMCRKLCQAGGIECKG